MSRIGKNPVAIPDGVDVQIDGQNIKTKGKLGELSLTVHDDVAIVMEDQDGAKVVALKPKNETPIARQVWPTMRTLVNNMVTGVSAGYSKKLEIKGVGYRANLQGSTLVMTLGFSHEIRYNVPEGIKITMEGQTGIEVSGIDKQKVGQVAANIRGYKPPEPYKGKGIRYSDEFVIRKEGKKK